MTNKTIVACAGIITLGVTLIAIVGLYIYFYAGRTIAKTETRDRLTVCMQMVMQESRESQQPVNIDKAREICG